MDVFARTETLSDRASNPITNLSQLQFENDFTVQNYGTDESANTLLIKPLIALNRTCWFPFEQLIRFKFQIPTIPHSSKTSRCTSLGDTQFFDLFTVEQHWGRWGVGPMAIFPTATKFETGQGKWQLGPAVGISVLKFTGWQVGFLAQNPISLAGNKCKSKQNYLLLQPFIIYHFLKNTYIISNGEWTFNWRNNTKQIPLNIGIGHTGSLMGGIKIDASIQYQWMAYQNAATIAGFVNRYTWLFSVNILFSADDT